MYPAEHAALQRTLESLDVESGELEALDHRVHDLRSQLRQSVEILEEDHGKAIFVFTMVTTIFLPLYVVDVYVGTNLS
jgi:Mg2+ and Co2+ transporter CorA